MVNGYPLIIPLISLLIKDYISPHIFCVFGMAKRYHDHGRGVKRSQVSNFCDDMLSKKRLRVISPDVAEVMDFTHILHGMFKHSKCKWIDKRHQIKHSEVDNIPRGLFGHGQSSPCLVEPFDNNEEFHGWMNVLGLPNDITEFLVSSRRYNDNNMNSCNWPSYPINHNPRGQCHEYSREFNRHTEAASSHTLNENSNKIKISRPKYSHGNILWEEISQKAVSNPVFVEPLRPVPACILDIVSRYWSILNNSDRVYIKPPVGISSKFSNHNLPPHLMEAISRIVIDEELETKYGGCFDLKVC
jgi:hypothetical protein